MNRITIYHNPACSKSRAALEILRQHGIECDVVEYLKAPPDRTTLERVLSLLAGPPADLVRKDERFKKLGLHERDHQTREQVLALLSEHPELMERPVVVRGSRALIARPPEKILELLD
jgi:arsenate reductase